MMKEEKGNSVDIRIPIEENFINYLQNLGYIGEKLDFNEYVEFMKN